MAKNRDVKTAVTLNVILHGRFWVKDFRLTDRGVEDRRPLCTLQNTLHLMMVHHKDFRVKIQGFLEINPSFE